MNQRNISLKNNSFRQTTARMMIILAAWLLLLADSQVSAAPVMLQSATAIVYEAADEGSTPVGNLVQGNTFELSGSITAEDGSQWYAISMSSGRQGYIKGEALLENQDAVPTGGDNTAGAGNVEDDAAAEEDGNAEDGADGDGLNEEDDGTQDMPAGNRPQVIGTKEKTYAILADAQRIKSRTQQEAEISPKLQASGRQQTGGTVDKTWVELICIAMLSLLLLCYCCRRLRQMRYPSTSTVESHRKFWFGNHKAKKKRKVRKKKQAKKKRKVERNE